MIKLIQIWSFKLFGLLLKLIQFLIIFNLLLWWSNDLCLIQSRRWSNYFWLNNWIMLKKNSFGLSFRLIWVYWCLLESLIELILNFVFHWVDINLWFVLLFPLFLLLLWTPIFNWSLDHWWLFILWGLAAALRRGLFRRGWRRWLRRYFKDGTLAEGFLLFVYLSSIIRFLFLLFLHSWLDFWCLFHSK